MDNLIKGKQLSISNLIVHDDLTVLGNISGSIQSASFASTASFLVGTIASASFANTANNAITASYIQNAISASYTKIAISASYVQNAISASYSINSITSSYSQNTLSSSYSENSETASYADNFTINGNEIIGNSQTSYNNINLSTIGNNNLFSQDTGSFTSAFFKYTVSSGSNSRVSEVLAVWNINIMTYTDFSTVDIGTTSAVTSSVFMSGGQVQFNIQTNTPNWTIKSLATYI